MIACCGFVFLFCTVIAYRGHPQQDLRCPGNELAGRIYYGDFGEFEFDCETLSHSGVDPETGQSHVESAQYRVEREGALSYLYLRNVDKSRLLVLSGGSLLYLYADDGSPPSFFGVAAKPNGTDAIYYFPNAFSASSSLTEGTIRYGPENLDKHWTRTPWVEGVPGHGIGEEIRIDTWFPRLWISIGFVSYDRPELYELNSRPKRLRVVSDATGEERIVDLEDTPNLQPIEVPGEWESAGDGGIRLIIEEVYPGTRWDDTCINFIVFF
jgi:hypothetical protein